MATLFSRQGAERLKKRVVDGQSERGNRLAGALYNQFNDLHKIDFYDDIEIEELLLKQKEHDLEQLKDFKQLPEGLISFSPSPII